MDFKNPRLGAAGVSIVWMVSVIVLFFVALGVAFVASDEAAQNREALVQADQAVIDAKAEAKRDRDKFVALSEVIGFDTGGGGGGPVLTDVKLVEAGLAGLKSSFPDMDDGTVKTIEDAFPKVIEAYNNVLTKNRTLVADAARLQSEVSSRDSQLSSMASTKDSEIEDLRSQLTDQKQSSDDRIAVLENERNDLSGQVKDKDQKVKAEQGKYEDLERRAREAKQRAEARMNEQGKALAFLKEPEAADGEILAVSTDGTLGWINLGNKNRLARGTKFRVVRGTPGSKHEKARAEVLHVQDDMAQVMFYEIKDAFAPPTAGDVIYNPIYDPKSERFAMLLGRFSGTWNKGELSALLAELNITVQDNLDKTTDYVIVGGELYTDEDGEPLEEPLQASELPAYKDAVASGVQVVTLKDIREYFGPR